MIIDEPRIVCEICKNEFWIGQGYGIRGAKNKIQYTENLKNASVHICNGCLCAMVWVFEDSTKKKDHGMRY